LKLREAALKNSSLSAAEKRVLGYAQERTGLISYTRAADSLNMLSNDVQKAAESLKSKGMSISAGEAGYAFRTPKAKPAPAPASPAYSDGQKSLLIHYGGQKAGGDIRIDVGYTVDRLKELGATGDDVSGFVTAGVLVEREGAIYLTPKRGKFEAAKAVKAAS